jgi:hypothetical protein
VPAEWVLFGLLTLIVVIAAPLVLLAALAGWLLRAPIQAALNTPAGQVLVAVWTWQPDRQQVDTIVGVAILLVAVERVQTIQRERALGAGQDRLRCRPTTARPAAM